MIPLLFSRYFQPRSGSAVSDAARIYYHIYSDDVAGSTVDNVNELIPTLEDIDSLKESFIVEQAVQELAATVFMFSLSLPIKIAMEVHSIYDYLNE